MSENANETYKYGQLSVKGVLKYVFVRLKSPIRYDLISHYYNVFQNNNHQPQGRKFNAGVSKAAKRQGPGAGRARQPFVYGHGRRVVTVPNAVGGRLAHPPRSIRRRKKLNKKFKARVITEIYKSMFDTALLSNRPRINLLESNCIVIPDGQLSRKFSSVRHIFEKLGISKILKFSKIKCNVLILALSKQVRAISSYNIKGYNYGEVQTHSHISELIRGGCCGRLTLITHGAFKKVTQDQCIFDD